MTDRYKIVLGFLCCGLLGLAGCGGPEAEMQADPPFEIDPALVSNAWTAEDCIKLGTIPWPKLDGGIKSCIELVQPSSEPFDEEQTALEQYGGSQLVAGAGEHWLIALCTGIEELHFSFDNSQFTEFTAPCAEGTPVIHHLGTLAEGESPGWLVIHPPKQAGSIALQVGIAS